MNKMNVSSDSIWCGFELDITFTSNSICVAEEIKHQKNTLPSIAHPSVTNHSLTPRSIHSRSVCDKFGSSITFFNKTCSHFCNLLMYLSHVLRRGSLASWLDSRSVGCVNTYTCGSDAPSHPTSVMGVASLGTSGTSMYSGFAYFTLRVCPYNSWLDQKLSSY